MSAHDSASQAANSDNADAIASDSPHAEVSKDSADTGTRISIRNLTVQAGRRTLLENTGCEFPAGEVILLLGCSGVGKSVLLKILAGLIDASHDGIQYTGEIEFAAADGSRRRVANDDHPVAVVFQNFALLDELSPQQNVQIALDHTRRSRRNRIHQAAELLDELRVPTDRPTSVLSGGQQQRLAIARAIAPDTDVVLYDEPTSGLDARTAEQVADLIRDTQRRHRRTSILVTHDYETLSRIADRIILLDHTKLRLVELPKSQWTNLPAALGNPPVAATDPIVHSWKNCLRSLGVRFLTKTGIIAEDVLLLPFSLLPLWRSWRWGLRYTLYYMRLVAGPSACVYIAVAGMILGYVAQDFVFRYLPFRQFTEPLLTENLLNATGFSLFRFLVPILATILIAARSGAAVSADIGSKVYGNQLDAMKTIGMNPARSLRTPILYAFLLGTPFLSLLSYAAAALTAAFAFLLTHEQLGIAFWDAHFHKELLHPSSFFYKGSGWLLAKLVCCGLGVATISWRCGVTPKLSGAEISQGVTRTILWATLLVLTVHFVFSLLEFRAVS
ncbi:MAG TPA: ABC transporter permease [Planctomycetaceae bacterium]|nr:ABC transporter permease [Planctomycetaceae bacterium]HQZ66281.1 ABC transporter permease [Planctomycetaceae bacterium]